LTQQLFCLIANILCLIGGFLLIKGEEYDDYGLWLIWISVCSGFVTVPAYVATLPSGLK